MKFDKNHAIGIEAFLKQLGLNQNYKGTRENVFGRIQKEVNKYIADNQLALTEDMKRTHTFPIEILSEVLIAPTDKVVMLPNRSPDIETELTAPYVEYIDELVDEGSKIKSDSFMFTVDETEFSIMSPEDYSSSVVVKGVTTVSMEGKEYKILLSLSESKNRSFTVTTNLFRKLLNWVRTHKPSKETSHNITEVEEWLSRRGTHRGAIGVIITHDSKLTLTCINKATRNGQALSLVWDADVFLSSLKSVTPLIK